MLVLFTVPKCVKLCCYKGRVWHLLLRFDLIKSCVVLFSVLHFAGNMRHFAVWVWGFANWAAYFEKNQPCLRDCALALGEKKQQQPCNQENVAFEEKRRRTYWFDDGLVSDQRPLMDGWMFHLQTERSPSSLSALSRASQALHLNCLGHLGETVVK